MNGKVVVAVPTFRRVVWAGDLATALVQEVGERQGCAVVLLDNDPDASADVLRDHPAVRSGGVRLHHVGQGDVVSVRNAAVDQALLDGARFLVLLDDDEFPQGGWLDALLVAQQRWDAHVVTGPVRQDPAILHRPDVRAMLSRAERPAGPFTGDVGGGNVLVDLDLVVRAGVRFDPRLGRSGGEDTLFFRQLALAGARSVWAPDALVVERPVPERVTTGALLRRSYRNGRSSVAVDRALGEPPGRARRAAVLLGAAAAYLPTAAREAARGEREEAWRRVFKVVRHAGRLRGPGGPGTYGGSNRPRHGGLVHLGSTRSGGQPDAGEVG
ncbi:glycosyltransferase family 2 protein [Ornithinimicrobium sp. W1665]|uniref:glycosyltransferase family 2 protein n=1 Tax=Ornithinimicrobium sp. W1665 TaxID=3416666 RepID=UPI003CF87987